MAKIEANLQPLTREANLQLVADNRGTHAPRPVPEARFPDVGAVLAGLPTEARPAGAVDVLLVNPPAPDGAIWIRSQHRVGRRSRENMIWAQVDLAQLAALLYPDYTVEIVDAIATRMSWPAFERLLRARRPRYYVTQVTAPTLTNDMRGAFLARSLGAHTIAFGTHVTPLPVQTLEAFPALDFVLRGEPELTLVELIDTLQVTGYRFQVTGSGQPSTLNPQSEPSTYPWPLLRRWEHLFRDSDPTWTPPWRHPDVAATNPRSEPSTRKANLQLLSSIRGLAWRDAGGQVRVNADRPFIRNLDGLPLPMHHLLPWHTYRAPNIKGPYTFVVTSRGCPAGCTFCIKHVSYQNAVRVRSAENILEELRLLRTLPPPPGSKVKAGLRNVHMYADLFTVSREQVMDVCEGMIAEEMGMRWTANSRVDFVDPEMLGRMAQAGCWLISWGIESANERIRKNVRKGTTDAKIAQALRWSKEAGIMNWGYFIIGLPGETEETIRQTIDLAKKLPLDLALFHIAGPYPGTPFFYQVVENGWFRRGTAWEEVDMDESTVLDYPGLPAERIEYWASRAFREWAFRPGPILTYLKSMNNWAAARSAMNVGLQALGWIR